MGLLDRIRLALGPAPLPPNEVADGANPNDLSFSPYGSGYSSTPIINQVTGEGTFQDPRTSDDWLPQRILDKRELFAMGKHALTRRGLALSGDSAVREGWTLDITDERFADDPARAAEISRIVTEYETRIGLPQQIKRALTKGRQYSDALIWLGIRDGRFMDQPVDVNNIKTISWAVTIDRRFFSYEEIAGLDTPGVAPGQPTLFRIDDIAGVVEDGLNHGTTCFEAANFRNLFESTDLPIYLHHSRVLRFPSYEAISDLDGLQDAFGAYLTGIGGVRKSLAEHSTVIYAIDNWIQKMRSKDRGHSIDHMRLVDRARGAFGAWIIDKKHEDVSQLQRALGGIDGAQSHLMNFLQAALGYPGTKYFGTSPSGFGTGASEEITFEGDTREKQADKLTPQLTKSQGYMLAAKDGANVPHDIQRVISYHDLTPPDDKVKQEILSSRVGDTLNALKEGALTPDEASATLAGLNTTDFSFAIDTEAREAAATERTQTLTPISVGVAQAVFKGLELVGQGAIPAEALAIVLPQFEARFTLEFAQQLVSVFAQPTPGPTEQPLEVPEDETIEDEPDDLQLAFEKTPLPSDGDIARNIAAKLSEQFGKVSTVSITNLARQGRVKVWNILGVKKFSLRDVERVIAEDNDLIERPEVVDQGTIRVGVFAVLPPGLAAQFPERDDDRSPTHVTLLFVGDIAPEQLGIVKRIAESAAQGLGPIESSLGELDFFDNDDETVAFASVETSPPLQPLHKLLRSSLESEGVDVRHRPGFTPHVTLAILEPGQDYLGETPEGSWTIGEIEVWAHPTDEPQKLDRSVFPLGSREASGEVADVIEKDGDEYVVKSKAGEVLGRHPTREAAERQLAAVEASKKG